MCHLPMERTGTIDIDLGHLNVCIWATYTYVSWIGAKTYGDGASGSWVKVEPHSEGTGIFHAGVYDVPVRREVGERIRQVG